MIISKPTTQKKKPLFKRKHERKETDSLIHRVCYRPQTIHLFATRLGLSSAASSSSASDVAVDDGRRREEASVLLFLCLIIRKYLH